MNIQITIIWNEKLIVLKNLQVMCPLLGWGGMGLISPQKFSFFVLLQELLVTKTTRTIYKYLGDGHDLLLPYLIKVQTTFKSNHITPGLGDHHQVLIQHCIARLKSFTVKNN